MKNKPSVSALQENLAAERYWWQWVDDMNFGKFLEWAAIKIRSDVRVHNQTTTWSPMISRLEAEAKRIIKEEKK